MIIKSIYCSDDRPYATLDAQRYIFNEAKVPIGGTFAYGCAPERWSSSNISTKIIWRKKGRGKYYHIVIGFDPADNVPGEKAVRIGKKISRFSRTGMWRAQFTPIPIISTFISLSAIPPYTANKKG